MRNDLERPCRCSDLTHATPRIVHTNLRTFGASVSWLTLHPEDAQAILSTFPRMCLLISAFPSCLGAFVPSFRYPQSALRNSSELSTITSNLRTSSPNLYLTTCLPSTCRTGGNTTENLRTSCLSTSALRIRSPRPRISVSPTLPLTPSPTLVSRRLWRPPGELARDPCRAL